MDAQSRRERTEEMNQVKQIIRSVIEANGNRISIQALVKEYKKITDTQIPIASLGFYSVHELIQECDDWFGIERSDSHISEWQHIVYCKPDKNTEHLVDLIANQKQPKDKDKVVLRPVVCFNPFQIRQTVHQRPKSVKPFKLEVIAKTNNIQKESDLNSGPLRLNLKGKKKQTSLYKPVCPLPDTRIIPNEQKLKISSLLTQYKNISLVNFEIIYKLFHGQPLDCKRIGFSSVDQFLKAIPDLVRVEEKNGGPIIYSNEVEQCPNNIDQNSDRDVLADIQPKSNERPNDLIVNREKELKRIRCLLKSYPNGIEVKQFIDLYRKTYKTLFACENWGYTSPIEMFAKMRDVFTLKRSENNLTDNEEWIVFDCVNCEKSDQTKKTCQKRRFGIEFKEKVNQVMSKINKTPQMKISVEDFPSAYYLLFHETVEPKTYGFNNWKQLLLELSKECDFDLKERIKNQPFLVFIKKSV